MSNKRKDIFDNLLSIADLLQNRSTENLQNNDAAESAEFLRRLARDWFRETRKPGPIPGQGLRKTTIEGYKKIVKAYLEAQALNEALPPRKKKKIGKLKEYFIEDIGTSLSTLENALTAFEENKFTLDFVNIVNDFNLKLMRFLYEINLIIADNEVEAKILTINDKDKLDIDISPIGRRFFTEDDIDTTELRECRDNEGIVALLLHKICDNINYHISRIQSSYLP